MEAGEESANQTDIIYFALMMVAVVYDTVHCQDAGLQDRAYIPNVLALKTPNPTDAHTHVHDVQPVLPWTRLPCDRTKP